MWKPIQALKPQEGVVYVLLNICDLDKSIPRAYELAVWCDESKALLTPALEDLPFPSKEFYDYFLELPPVRGEEE